MDLPYLIQINVSTAPRLLNTCSLACHGQVLHPSLVFDNGLLGIFCKSAFRILDMVVVLTGFPLGPHSTACGSLVLFLLGSPLDHLNLVINDQFHLIVVDEPNG